MSVAFAKRVLYGGAIDVELPFEAVDVSNLRSVPDHQEVFLRPDTLTSYIFEINEHQSSEKVNNAALDTASTTSEGNDVGNSTIPPADNAAANYHLRDTVDPSDQISDAGIETVLLKLDRPSVTKFPTYLSTTTIIAKELDRNAAPPVEMETQTKVQQLLIRMKQYDTDFCVRINVPLKEFNGAQSEAALTELARADQVMAKVVETLDITDFGLFGSGE